MSGRPSFGGTGGNIGPRGIPSGGADRVHRQVSPPSFWYDQEEDEWLVLLRGEGRVAYPDGKEDRLLPGDTLFLPAHRKHRVSYTSAQPPAVWLCVFGRMEGKK